MSLDIFLEIILMWQFRLLVVVFAFMLAVSFYYQG